MDTLGKTIVLNTNAKEAREVAGWLRNAGLGIVATARTADEAIFMLGRQRAGLLIIDEAISAMSEQRLLTHIAECTSEPPPVIVRLLPANVPDPCAAGQVASAAIARKPLQAHDVVVCVGTAMQRPDLVGKMYRGRDQSGEHLAAARRMQLALLPTHGQLAELQSTCGIGVSGLCRSGEAVGGDFWGAWPTGKGRFALALADFAGHGLSAALNTFRLHAILSEQTLPRGTPALMSTLLNERLHTLLPRGQYATMIYAQIHPSTQRISWCSAGGPPPMFVSARGVQDLQGHGLPLGVRSATIYRSNAATIAGPGIFCMFSDGLYESGQGSPDVPRAAIAEALMAPVALAAAGKLTEAAATATCALEALRDRYPCLDHSDDVMVVCVALGPVGHRESSARDRS